MSSSLGMNRIYSHFLYSKMSKVSLLDRLQDICPLPLDESDSLPGKAIDKDSMKRKMLDGHMQGYYTDLSF